MKHEDKMDMHKHHHKPWQSNWKSPVSLGIFLLTAALALAILLYTILNIVGAIMAAAHPNQGLSAQDMQQLEQQMPTDSGSSATAPTGATGQ